MQKISSEKRELTQSEAAAIINDAWLGIRVDESKIYNPLATIPREFEDEPHMYILWLMQQPEYFSFICKEILNVELLPIQALMLREMWHRRFPMLIASRGFGKSFMLAVYSLLRILLLPSRRVVICGAAFRQSKVIFDYMDAIWKNAPLLRDIMGNSITNGPKRDVDMCRFHLGDSVAIALPIGDGQKIRGQRANDIISDEFAATSRDVFENVIAGFGVVRSSPVEAVKERATKDLAQRFNIAIPYSTNNRQDNQIILSGTAYYDFNHFGEYWKRWGKIIRSKGEKDKLELLFGDGNVPEDFAWTDYSIIRLPFELIPRGFMDEAMVARSRATIHTGIYMMEFGAVFSNDSNGFFKRTLIESCVLTNDNEITLPSGPVHFTAMLRGYSDRKYVISVDPASEVDNCAITILEHYTDHRRIVYVWTITRKEHKERIRLGLCQETDFYAFIARRVRDLMKMYPCIALPIDTQGGGIALMESLHDLDKLQEGEVPIWPIIDPNKPNPDTDGQPGLHIIHPINFSSAEWTGDANHGLRKDFEDKVCIFPFFDSLSLGLAAINDEQGNKIYDTLEDCLLEIEELKNELSTIVVTQTQTGRDRWDTPEIKLPGNKKGRMRKDRYSALLMANMVSRTLARNPLIQFQESEGGWAKAFKTQPDGKEYVGSAWLANSLSGLYD
jgi:hypothetical protein